MDAVLTKAKKGGALKKGFSLSGGKGSMAISGKKKKGKYKFSWGDNGKAGKVEEFAATDDNKYKYNQKQIVDNDSVSIWEVISNRYSTSGIRRLFEE